MFHYVCQAKTRVSGKKSPYVLNCPSLRHAPVTEQQPELF
jgi:hypothetical protein